MRTWSRKRDRVHMGLRRRDARDEVAAARILTLSREYRRSPITELVAGRRLLATTPGPISFQQIRRANRDPELPVEVEVRVLDRRLARR